MARILVVDDEPDVRELFNITLKMAGHTTETARDGVEAVNKLQDSIPDLILLDLMMPNLDGFGFLSHVREKMDSKPIRVLIATAKVLEEADNSRLNSWPVVGVLNKGALDIGQMVVIVSSALAKSPLKNGSKKEDPEPAQKKEAVAKPAPAAIPQKPAPAVTVEKPAAAADVKTEAAPKPAGTGSTSPVVKPEVVKNEPDKPASTF